MDDAAKETTKDWVWRPNTSYGPFIFGTHRSVTPHVGLRRDMGNIDASEPFFFDSTIGSIRLSFWNDYLTSVQSNETFIIEGTELIGARFEDVRHLVDEKPEIDKYVFTIFAEFDNHNSMWSLDTDWLITSVDVGIDPERVPDRP